MFCELVLSEGLAHHSYLIGDSGVAAVIDPRRDGDIYLALASSHGARITRIFETHRNEDYLIGSRDLAALTEATIHHHGAVPFTYGTMVDDGDVFTLGSVRLTVLHTPGHTMESIALAVADRAVSEAPWGVFTGDTLFVGSVGRTDLFPGREEEMARYLYVSLFQKLLPLGDQVIIYPAHGQGSACGAHLRDRVSSTIGYERRHNPALQAASCEAFVQARLAERLERPPYFDRMEALNTDGPLLTHLPRPALLSPEEFNCRDLLVLDLREPEAFGGAHIPGAWNLPLPILAHYAGWALPHDQPLALVVEDVAQLDLAVRILARMGYESLEAALVGMRGWATAGLPFTRIVQISMRELLERRDAGESVTILDVRKEAEYTAGHLPGVQHLFVGELPARWDEIPSDRPVVTLCSTGQRASLAASLLRANGWTDIENCLGSMAACDEMECPIERAA